MKTEILTITVACLLVTSLCASDARSHVSEIIYRFEGSANRVDISRKSEREAEIRIRINIRTGEVVDAKIKLGEEISLLINDERIRKLPILTWGIPSLRWDYANSMYVIEGGLKSNTHDLKLSRFRIVFDPVKREITEVGPY